MNELRKRMIEDLRPRNYSDQTIAGEECDRQETLISAGIACQRTITAPRRL